MITFRELKRGDKVIVKNRAKAIPCDVIVDGRRFLAEAVETDDECTVHAFPHYDNGLGGKLVEFYLYDADGEPIKETILVDDLDRTETSRFKIVQSDMIEEDYVSFKTAKLLKEKGFDSECSRFYMPNGHGRWKYEHYHDFDISERIECPTLQMAMKWLREMHKIHIQIWILEENGYWFDIEKILNAQYKHKSLYSTGLEDIYFESYEEACEAAIKYCLENLI